ncbi:DUF5074 domain-containing protein [Fibrella sp. WM1]|uniref:DUF5074 domain-containing protein n=1 Tax=Fibrella musci TaxID=3242485 RepID=UPI0035218384
MKLTSFSARLLSAATLTSLLLACNRNTDPQPATSLYTDGVFILNAGNFSDNNGTLSWLPRTGSTAQTNLFQVRNGRPLTGGVSGYVEAGNRGLILVDNMAAGLDKVEIVSADSLRSVKTLAAPDIENPRAAARVSDTKVYVTCWGTTGSSPFYVNPGYIAVVDLTTNTVTKRITLQKGAEGVTVVGNEAYVTGQGGERIIQVIDTQTDAVKTSIAVTGSISPLVVDANGKLWGTQGKNVVRIDPATKAIEATIPVGVTNGANASASSPSGLVASADRRSMYYKYTSYDANFNPVGQVYRFSITDATITPTTPVVNRTFTGLTGLGFDTKANVVYAGVTPSYKQAGYVYRYQATGQLIDSVRVEIAPTAFYVK